VEFLAQQFSKYELWRYYQSFVWRKMRLSNAWNERLNLENYTKQFESRDSLSLADRIHKWGFGHNFTSLLEEKSQFRQSFCRLISVWRVPGLGPGEQLLKTDALSEMLSLNRVGIAKASKWICFIDQSRYAIYDSRVALALRNISIDGERIFPIIGRRATGGRKSWNADGVTSNPKAMAALYWSYLRVVNRVAELTEHGVGSPIAGRQAILPCRSGNGVVYAR
jgi:hypothetical protein